MNKFIFALLTILFAVALAFILGKRYCEKDAIIQKEAEEKQVIQTILKETKKVNERRVQALTVSHDDNILWLEANICQNC